MYHALLAELAARRGQLDTAYDSYMIASRYSSDAQLPERAARIAVFAKAWDQAVVASQRWLALDASNAEVRHILATSYMRLKDSDAAQQQFLIIIEGHPDGIEPGMAVSYALLRHEANQQLSLSIAKTLASSYEKSPGAQFNLARLSAAMGDKATTLQALDNTLALQPGHIEATLLRAQMLADAGESDAAFAGLREALRQFPDDIKLNLGYTRLLVHSGQDDLAVGRNGKNIHTCA